MTQLTCKCVSKNETEQSSNIRLFVNPQKVTENGKETIQTKKMVIIQTDDLTYSGQFKIGNIYTVDINEKKK